MTATQKSAVFKDVEELSEDDCLHIARLKMKRTDVVVENVTMKMFGETPAGFGGDHYRLKMTVKPNSAAGDSNLVDLHFFVKTKPRDEAHCDFIERFGVVKKELDFFSILMGLLHKYVSDEKDNNEKIQVPWTADCYLVNMKLIVLDDLSHEDYSLLENRASMSFDQCVVMLETIARFHASTIIFEEKESQERGVPYRLNEVYPDIFKENTWTYDPPDNAGKQISEAGIKGLISLVKIMPQVKRDPKKLEAVLNAMDNLFRDMNKLVAVSTEVRNVVTHGDLWTNNILFQHDSASGKPTAARIIDFQLLRYTAPAHDFICALYLNTRRELRDKHFESLAEVYHSAFAAELRKHDLRIEELVPWTEFRASLERYRMLGLFTAGSYFPATLLPDEVASVVFKDPVKLNTFMMEDMSEAACQSFGIDEIYRERICEVVDELAEYVMQ